MPKDVDFKQHEASNAQGSNELYNTLRTAMNQEMMVGILGATETTTSSESSGYAQSQTHADTIQDLLQDDMADELSILNSKVLPIMVYLGLLKAGGKFVYDAPIDMAKTQKKVDAALLMKKSNIPVSDNWFYETTGIPRPDNYDDIKAEIANDKMQSLIHNNPTDKKLAAWQELRLKLSAFFRFGQ